MSSPAFEPPAPGARTALAAAWLVAPPALYLLIRFTVVNYHALAARFGAEAGAVLKTAIGLFGY